MRAEVGKMTFLQTEVLIYHSDTPGPDKKVPTFVTTYKEMEKLLATSEYQPYV